MPVVEYEIDWSEDRTCRVPNASEREVVAAVSRWMKEYVAEHSKLPSWVKPADRMTVEQLPDGTLIACDVWLEVPAEERHKYTFPTPWPYAFPRFRAFVSPNPGQGATVTISYTEGDFLRPMAETLIAELQRQWSGKDSTYTEARPEFRGQSGRPRNEDDDWAWEQVNVLKRPRPEVEREWKRRIGERAFTLADVRDSFKQAVRPRRGTKSGGKITE